MRQNESDVALILKMQIHVIRLSTENGCCLHENNLFIYQTLLYLKHLCYFPVYRLCTSLFVPLYAMFQQSKELCNVGILCNIVHNSSSGPS